MLTAKGWNRGLFYKWIEDVELMGAGCSAPAGGTIRWPSSLFSAVF